jgi:hypothetical protein
MAGVPMDEIDRIKREVSIVRLVSAHGIELKPYGKNLVGRCAGVVGEQTTLLVGILAAVSRLLEFPLAVVIQSSSAAGES